MKFEIFFGNLFVEYVLELLKKWSSFGDFMQTLFLLDGSLFQIIINSLDNEIIKLLVLNVC